MVVNTYCFFDIMQHYSTKNDPFCKKNGSKFGLSDIFAVACYHRSKLSFGHIALADGDLEILTACGLEHFLSKRRDSVNLLVGKETIGFDIPCKSLAVVGHGISINLKDVEETAYAAGH